MSLLAPKQAQFASALASETGLNPRVISSWLLAEQSGSAAKFYEGKGYNNWLNIARTDSGDAGGAHSSVWKNPASAARATAEWLQGRGQIAHEYGKPAAGIQAILHTAHTSPQEQIHAIATSGWASSGYNGGSTLTSLYGELGGEKLPAVASEAAHAHAGAAIANELAPHLSGGPEAGPNSAQSADLVALLQAVNSQKPATATLSGPRRPQSSGGGEVDATAPKVPQAPSEAPAGNDPSAILDLLSRIGQETTPESEAPEGAPGHQPAHEVAAEHPGHYVNPLPGFTKGRTDQGVDYSAKPGAPIRAIGNGRVLPIAANWYEGQPYVSYELQDGPQKGKVVYVAEQIHPEVHAGQTVRAGQRIGTYASHGTAIETGYGTRTPGQVASPYNGRPDGTETQGGKAARAFLERLGAR